MGVEEGKPERHHAVDWLRVLAVLLLVPYHSAVIFDKGHVSYIKDQPNAVLEAFAHFLFQWHMPLLFLLSGAATSFALGFRTGGRYAGERVRRLLIPLTFGTLAVIPILVYCQRLFYQQFQGSYVRFYPSFFEGIYPHGNFSWGHLWFLAYLFVFSLLGLPLSLFLRKERGRKLISKLAASCDKGGMIFLLAAPLALIEATLRARWPGFQNLYADWANFFSCLTVFIYGYILFSDPRFTRTIERHGKTSLRTALATMTIIFALRWTDTAPAPKDSVTWILYMLLHGFNCWVWILAILSFALKHLQDSNRVLPYAVEAVLPFYVLHHALVVGIGYHVVRWNTGEIEKFTVITAASLAATLCLYDLFVRRTPVTRILFGMKPKKHLPAA